MSFADAHPAADSHAKRDAYADCDYLSYTNADAERLPRRLFSNAKPNGYAFAHGSSGVKYLDAAPG